MVPYLFSRVFAVFNQYSPVFLIHARPLDLAHFAYPHATQDGEVEQSGVGASSMEEAVKIAKSLAEKGDTVLLSPCCASFDLFNNYEHRGQLFKEEVLKNN